jgi:hypothetical protein
MSKGLSRQQCRILGLAVAISRLRNGAPVPRVPMPHRHWRVPVVTNGWPDVSIQIAVHVCGGAAIRRIGSHWCLDTARPALTARASISRAISSLVQRELLALRVYVQGETDLATFGRNDGYVLTAKGIAAGLPHEEEVPELALRLWRLDRNFRKHWTTETRHPADSPVAKAYRDIGITWPHDESRVMAAPGQDVPEVRSHRVAFGGWRPIVPHHTPPVIDHATDEMGALADKARALITQNDPDVVRAGLVEICRRARQYERARATAGLSLARPPERCVGCERCHRKNA